jgi:hypothetical protein
MLEIVTAIYKMTGQMVRLPEDEDTPEKVGGTPPVISLIDMDNDVICTCLYIQRVDKIFQHMDRDKDAKLTYEEFVEGSKQDPTIVQVKKLLCPILMTVSDCLLLFVLRPCRFMMASYERPTPPSFCGTHLTSNINLLPSLLLLLFRRILLLLFFGYNFIWMDGHHMATMVVYKNSGRCLGEEENVLL